MSENFKFQQTEKERKNHIFEESHCNYSTRPKKNVLLDYPYQCNKQQITWKDMNANKFNSYY
jgi:hypothetical protein